MRRGTARGRRPARAPDAVVHAPRTAHRDVELGGRLVRTEVGRWAWGGRVARGRGGAAAASHYSDRVATPRPGTRAHTLEIVRRLGGVRAAPVPPPSPAGGRAGDDAAQPQHHRRQPGRGLRTPCARVPDLGRGARARPTARGRGRRSAWPASPTRRRPRIQGILDRIADDPRGADLEWLGRSRWTRRWPSSRRCTGVGPKTAACVMCFCFDAHIVPADTHVHRIALRTGIVPPGDRPPPRPGAPDRAGRRPGRPTPPTCA